MFKNKKDKRITIYSYIFLRINHFGSAVTRMVIDGIRAVVLCFTHHYKILSREKL